MPRTQDRTASLTAAGGVAVVAMTAALISFSHVRALAIRAGESELASWLLPVSIDGAIAAAVAVILADSRAGRRPAGLTWLLLVLGLAGSLAGNIASAEPTMTARAVAAWPPIALALGIEVLAGLARRIEDTSPAVQSLPAPTDAAASQSDDRPTAERAHRPIRAGTGTGGAAKAADRQPSPSDTEAVAMIRQLDAAAPAGRVSRLQIQQRLGCGGSKAARLATIARRGELPAAP
ncbi:DUF2637 domain-containing protein [Nocardioides ungokensis]|uniref:DUF2637 domain-containing protein n=1 Tax=Nocardioides ungokensis TaxID=1643322 RepID=UPI0015E03580|nr:DUF2637 domain-containing protein [Nocardioides ungokensis]